TTASCGDGIRQGAELCDDGNTSNEDYCLNTCVPASCGDGFEGPGEQCDDGDDNGWDKGCTPACRNNVCGDGHVVVGADGRDDNSEVTEGACPYGIATCTLCNADCSASLPLTGGVCGDDHLDDEEVCDDGNAITETECDYNTPNGTCSVCNNLCTLEAVVSGPYCGDGSIDG